MAQVKDILVVGGGPGGTATAFAAKELGLDVLVIELDDLMTRIRDYPKEKQILPDFGGGNKIGFPAGGSLITALQFPPIDKDDLCFQWKALYHKHAVATRIGVELTDLTRRKDGIYEVQAWDHLQRCATSIVAKTIVLAVGRGVPRRFDISGNTDGIAYRLSEPALYVGRTACVIGGGTSAAEAVIAISNAKIGANDLSAVYWSYRGDKMPRVSKALADEFFSAYLGNGNIRYFPKSEPVAVVTSPEDRLEYLSICVDRRTMDGRPTETCHLEFAKDSCIACIGEDIPEALLHKLGIHMVSRIANDKKRMVVSRCLETEQPNVFVVGDILSQAYLQTEDFGADPSTFCEIKHRGNIKMALRDGVLVARAIKQRLEGRAETDLAIEDAENVYDAGKARAASVVESVGADGAPPDGVERSEHAEGAFLVRVLPGGVTQDEYPVRGHSTTTIGRRGCDLTFPDDTLLSDRHASLSQTADGYFLRDDGSANGVFVRILAAHWREVGHGDLIRIGRQFLVFTACNGEAFFTHFDAQGKTMRRHELPARTIVVGRSAPGIVLDPNDKTLSRRQLAISCTSGRIVVKDLKSVNGSHLRVRQATRITHGDEFRVGGQILQFNETEDFIEPAAIGARASSEPAPAPPTRPPEKPSRQIPAPSTKPDSQPTVKFVGIEGSFPVRAGQTICSVAEDNGLQINADCHAGVCGSDPIRILRGAENVIQLPGATESETLQELCDLEPGECRLACMVKVKGPVEVEILDRS